VLVSKWTPLPLLLLGLAPAAPAAIGCDASPEIGTPHGHAPIVVARHAGGRVDIGDTGGEVVLRGAWAEALVRVGGADRTLSTTDCDAAWTDAPAPARHPNDTTLQGKRYRCAKDGLALTWDVYVDAGRNTALALLDVTNESAAEVTVLRLTPVMTRGPDGGLFVGAAPSRTRILDNGSDVAGDVAVKLHYPDEHRDAFLGLLPIESRGDVVSNWNHAIVDLGSKRSWIAGALGVERTVPTFGTTYDPEDAPTADGRQGYGASIADEQLAFEGKPLAPGESVDAEPVYMDPLATDPWSGLEHYADAVASWLDFVAWPKRGRRVPNGWNSWSGSGGTGGLGTNIDETILAQNLDVMAREFEPFGVDYFQIDDGYERSTGDWVTRDDRFPSGMPALSAKIQAAGLLPGIWLSGFTVDLNSPLAKDHSEWLSRKEDELLGGLLSAGAGNTVLDLSNDDALGWLGDTIGRFKNEWGMRWVKLDFAYQALPRRPRSNGRLTSVEAYKRGIRKVREAAGDDVFYLGIALMGVNYGVVDGMRVTLDTGPRWEEEAPFDLFGNPGNLKQSVKTGARRYYLTDRVWVTHDDLMFFRSDTSRPDVTLSFDEAKSFASFIGLSGSIVKFGEDLRTLTPEQIDVWRKLLPIYPAAARPMDLFTRMYPETFRLPIEGTMAGSDARWLVVGLIDWGKNYDYTASGQPAPMADEARTYDVDLTSWGLDPDKTYLASEFWTESFLGLVKGRLTRTVRAHGHEVIALREATGHPQLLGHNRHFTQGATDLAREQWDDAARTLHLGFHVDAGAPGSVPFEYRFRVYVPPGMSLAGQDVGAGTVTQEGDVVTVHYLPTASGPYEMALRF
jgi:hypothetical protein